MEEHTLQIYQFARQREEHKMLPNYLLLTSEFIYYYLISKQLLHETLKPNKNDLIFLIGYLLLPSYATSPFLTILRYLLFFVYSLYLCRKVILEAFILYELTISLLLCCQLIFFLIFANFNLSMQSLAIELLGNASALVLTFLLLLLPKFNTLYFKIMHAALPYHILFLNTFSILLVCIQVGKINPKILISNTVFIVFFLLFLITANACTLYYDICLNLQEQKLTSYKKNLPIYEALIHEIRANQHEYSNRIQNLQSLTTIFTNYTDLCNAINKNTIEYVKPLHAYPLLQINMPLLAAALYRQFTIAEKKQIQIQFDVITENLKSSISESLLTDLCCILVQNAIEACSKTDNIYIRLSSDEQHTTFEIRNSVPKQLSNEEIHLFFKRNYTTKTDTISQIKQKQPHGYGLYYLHTVTLKNKGRIRADCIKHNNHYWLIFRLII